MAGDAGLAKTIHLAIQPIGGYPGVNGEVIIPWPSEGMAQELDDLVPGQPITPPEVLVTKISDEQIEELKLRFGGGA